MRRIVRNSLMTVPLATLALAGGGPNPTARNPLADSFFSIDTNSPEVVGGIRSDCDIMIPFGPVGLPTVVIPAINHRLTAPGDELDALSGVAPFGSPGGGPTFTLIFSVDRAAQGLLGPDPGLVAAGFPFNVLEQANRNQAAGDAFVSLTLFDRGGPALSPLRAIDNNTMVFNHGDAGGIDYNVAPATVSPDTSLPPMTPISDVDAAMGTGAPPPMPMEGMRGGGPPNLPFFFSARTGSPSLPLFGGTNSGADVYVDDLPDQPGGEHLYVDPITLGLQLGDDINALIVFDNGNRIFDGVIDQVIFTLTPDSDTLENNPSIGPGDIFTSSGGMMFSVFAFSHRLGVRQNDVVDMLDYVPCGNLMLCVQDWAIGLNCDCLGDTNCDGARDLNDLTNLLSGFGYNSSSPFYNERLDFDLNWAVNINDLAILLSNFGMPCDE